MKIFKTIFRLDFPLAYRILDKLGEYLELIQTKTSKEPFAKGQGNVNLLQHSLSYDARIGENVFTLNLDLRTFNSVIEFQDGLDKDKLFNIPLFSLADEIIKKLEDDHSPKYTRIGLRSFIIVEREEFSFQKLSRHMWDCNKLIGNVLTENFEEKQDIGIIFVAKSKSEESIRLHMGPYQDDEKVKYFRLENNVKEGIIFDIDIWQSNITMPALKLIELVRNHQILYERLVKEIELRLLEELR